MLHGEGGKKQNGSAEGTWKLSSVLPWERAGDLRWPQTALGEKKLDPTGNIGVFVVRQEQTEVPFWSKCFPVAQYHGGRGCGLKSGIPWLYTNLHFCSKNWSFSSTCTGSLRHGVCRSLECTQTLLCHFLSLWMQSLHLFTFFLFGVWTIIKGTSKPVPDLVELPGLWSAPLFDSELDVLGQWAGPLFYTWRRAALTSGNLSGPSQWLEAEQGHHLWD